MTVLWAPASCEAKVALNPGWPTDPNAPWDVNACVNPTYSLVNVNGVYDFQVRQGDQGAVGGGDRAELVNQTRAVTGMDTDGEIRAFYFSQRFDPSVQAPTSLQYQTCGQWQANGGPPDAPMVSPLTIELTGPTNGKRLEVMLNQFVNGGELGRTKLTSDALVVNHWYAWRFLVCWSENPNVGYVDIQRDGVELGRFPGATRYSDSAGSDLFNHFKIGLYRATDITTKTIAFYRDISITDGT